MPDGLASDEELLAALRAGDLAAFDRLYDRYARRLYGYIHRMVERFLERGQRVVRRVDRDGRQHVRTAAADGRWPWPC